MKKLFVLCSVVLLVALASQAATAQGWRSQAETPRMAADVSHFALLDNLVAPAEGLGWRLAAPAHPMPVATVGLWPNPAHGAVQIEAEAPTAPVQLFDALGRLKRTTPFVPGQTQLDLHDLPAGIYTVRVGTATARLVVE